MTCKSGFKFKLADQEDYDESCKQKIDQHSGLKVWESAYDLCDFLNEQIDWTTISNVLELGCGHGLPGLVALLHGKKVTFQDYDAETLEITRRTLSLNSSSLENAEFIASTWETFVISNTRQYDLILCSEAVYESTNFAVLSEIFFSSLALSGIGLVAGKKFYFGCGGGTLGFAEYVERSGKFSGVKSVRSIEDKRSNVREIVEVRL